MLDKSAGIGEAAVYGYLGNIHIVVYKEVGCAFNAVIIQVINGGTMHDGAEVAAEILGRKAGEPRQGFQGDVLSVMLFNVFQRRLELFRFLPCAFGNRMQLG